MSDQADLAQDRLDVEIGAALSRIDATIPAGMPGECDECGELMPRLVGGRCGFCRDGRRPPLSTFDRLAPPVAVPVSSRTGEEEEPMSAYKDGKYVGVPCDKRVLEIIERRAEAGSVSLGISALALVEAGIAAIDQHAGAAEPTAAEPATVVSLEAVPTSWLTEELQRRLDAASQAPALLDAAIARAEAAEGSWRVLREQLRGLVGEPA